MTRTPLFHLALLTLSAFVATPSVAQAQPAATGLPTPSLNSQDPCRAEVSKFEQAIAYVRQGQGAQVAAQMKEKWLPAKLESELLLTQGYCGIAKHLQDQKWRR